jgi:hypothetical protein
VPLDQPGRYTPLFFYDETASLAAGHRPCAMCRREEFERFKAAWRLAHGVSAGAFLTADEIDRSLHGDRIEKSRQRTWTAEVDELPSGVFLTLPRAPGQAVLKWHGHLHKWTPAGYSAAEKPNGNHLATVLTPHAIVQTILAGYAVGGPKFLD